MYYDPAVFLTYRSAFRALEELETSDDFAGHRQAPGAADRLIGILTQAAVLIEKHVRAPFAEKEALIFAALLSLGNALRRFTLANHGRLRRLAQETLSAPDVAAQVVDACFAPEENPYAAILRTAYRTAENQATVKDIRDGAYDDVPRKIFSIKKPPEDVTAAQRACPSLVQAWRESQKDVSAAMKRRTALLQKTSPRH